jgi:DNA-binding transcriptional regulator YdaS (Cro superfamily)
VVDAIMYKAMTNQDIIALVLAKAGGMHALGRALGINYQSFQKWKKIPAERVLAIEHITGIPREQLRPDLYGSYIPPPRRRHKKK